jgi:hypothetical protein
MITIVIAAGAILLAVLGCGFLETDFDHTATNNAGPDVLAIEAIALSVF